MNTSIKRNIIRIIVIALLLCVSLTNVIFATEIGGINVYTDKPSNNMGTLETTAERIVGVIQVVGILIAVGMIMVLGIKYMMGSAEEKAEYKKVFIPYLIGAILLFAASALAGAIYNMVDGLNPNP